MVTDHESAAKGRVYTVYVGNLPWRATEDDLISLFSRYGPLVDVRVIQDRFTGRSRGYGFVEFAREEHARAALADLDGVDFRGRPLMLSPARPKPPRC